MSILSRARVEPIVTRRGVPLRNDSAKILRSKMEASGRASATVRVMDAPSDPADNGGVRHVRIGLTGGYQAGDQRADCPEGIDVCVAEDLVGSLEERILDRKDSSADGPASLLIR